MKRPILNPPIKQVAPCLRSAGLFILLFLLLASATSSFAAQRKNLRNHVPGAARGQALKRLAETTALDFTIGLPLRNKIQLDKLIQQIYDPASPNFHKYLTPEQFAEQFGPTEKDYAKLIRFAQANGLTVTTTHPNRTRLGVRGSVRSIEKVFHVAMRVYQHPTEARAFYAPDTDPSIDIAIPLLSVEGLDNFYLPRPLSHKIPPARPYNVTPLGGSGPGGSYMGSDFRNAYAPGVALDGAGQSVGLVQFDGYYPADILAYRTQAGLPNVPLTNVLLDGFDGTPGPDNIEVALDIELVISMAPGLSNVIIYQAGPNGIPNDVLNRMATDNLSRQLSSSWLWSPFDSSAEQIFQQFAAQGQSFFQASGDHDAYAGFIDKPTDNPRITIVGGTMLTTDSNALWAAETVWNRNNGIGSGGGISTTYPIPTWQQGVSMTANQGSTTMRNTPDVALVSDDIHVIYDNGTSTSIGGTSCAAPLWAGFAALINQQAASYNLPSVGFINPAVYLLGKSGNYSSAFHDITNGNNFQASSPDKFSAVPGYDLCTGWGTPSGSNFINALVPYAPSIVPAGFVLASESCFPTNGAIDPGETVTVSFTLRNIGAASTTNLVATLLSTNGVSESGTPQNYGQLSNGMSASAMFTLTVTGACGGIIKPTFQLQDGPANLGTVDVSLALGATNTIFSENFDNVSQPQLPAGWTSMHGGQGSADWMTSKFLFDTSPNALFSNEPETPSFNSVTTPSITLPSSPVQLSFRNNFDLEADLSVPTYYDGGVLEIKIGPGTFTDILAAGGTFVSGGYTATLDPLDDNPFAGRLAWSGSSGDFITTVVNLPTNALGQAIQLRWRCGTDTGNAAGGSGWYIDKVALTAGHDCCSKLNITFFAATNDMFTLGWNSVSGAVYRVQYKTNGLQTNWLDLAPDITASGPTAYRTENVNAGIERYYRVTLIGY